MLCFSANQDLEESIIDLEHHLGARRLFEFRDLLPKSC